jgi:thiol-disulfide isomerase/thioredoxin
MINIESIDQFDKLIRSEKPVCALFTADWCPDCQVIKPVMPELEKDFADQYDFLSVDRDLFIELCQKMNVFGIPSFIAFRGGEEIGRFVNKARKTREEIENFLKQTETS